MSRLKKHNIYPHTIFKQDITEKEFSFYDKRWSIARLEKTEGQPGIAITRIAKHGVAQIQVSTDELKRNYLYIFVLKDDEKEFFVPTPSNHVNRLGLLGITRKTLKKIARYTEIPLDQLRGISIN